MSKKNPDEIVIRVPFGTKSVRIEMDESPVKEGKKKVTRKICD